jgi:hypothetical protein
MYRFDYAVHLIDHGRDFFNSEPLNFFHFVQENYENSHR